MNYLLNSHLYLHLKNIFALKKSSTFANLLIKKPLICYSKNVRKTRVKKPDILRKGPASSIEF